MRTKLLFITLFAVSFSSTASELRCGWLQNPGPANQWMTDKNGSWDISLQGRFSAEGIENLTDFPDKEFVRTNGNYGYGCACIKADTDHVKKRIIKIYSMKTRPLVHCQRDPTLHRP